jgi:hypothetical protein
MKKTQTLPTDSAERKTYPILSGCIRYFPAALAGVANISKQGNDKHNPGQPLHHARGKSTDHGDCILRHLIDVQDLLALYERDPTQVTHKMILTEVNQFAWRALAYSQELHEQLAGFPMAPGAKDNVILEKVKDINEKFGGVSIDQVFDKETLDRASKMVYDENPAKALMKAHKEIFGEDKPLNAEDQKFLKETIEEVKEFVKPRKIRVPSANDSI